ncbi:hypothetical protein V6N12_049778 [Hibiscus sabdariffa]|uniref:Uncharacterized protein n=1 Tax=Hibiscus sabdariffa TaxID=183260 RepID=A0ABR2GBN3_9ROSI
MRGYCVGRCCVVVYIARYSSFHTTVPTIALKKVTSGQGANKTSLNPKKHDERGQLTTGVVGCFASLVSDLDKVVAIERERLTATKVSYNESQKYRIKVKL